MANEESTSRKAVSFVIAYEHGEKVRMLNRDYDKWFFVVTNKNFAPKYAKFGDTCDMRYLKSKIDKILKNRAKLAKRAT